LPQFASKADQWDTVDRIRSDAKTVINLLADLTGLKLIAVDEFHEPQSELEDDASCDFTESIVNVIKKFLEARKNSTISHEADLADLKRTRKDMLQAIDRFSKFQTNCEDGFLAAVKGLTAQIDILEKLLTENDKLADLVLADVKALFEAAIVKLQTLPEQQISEMKEPTTDAPQVEKILPVPVA